MTDDIEGIREYAYREAIEHVCLFERDYDQVFALQAVGYLLFDISASLRTLVELFGSSAKAVNLDDVAPTAEALALLLRASQANEVTRQSRGQQKP